MFILDRTDRELPSLERLELKFGLSSEFFNKIPFRILLDVLFRVLRWLDTVFRGQYLPSLSINYVAINNVLEKLLFGVTRWRTHVFLGS